MNRLLIFFLLLPLSALATDDKRTTVDTDVTTNVTTEVVTETILTAGDNISSNSTSIEGGRGLGLSNSLGDVAISGCLGSTQWATPLFSKQKLSINWTCLAEFYLRTHRWELAAIALCNTEIRQEFPDEDTCRMAHDFSPLAEHQKDNHDDHEQIILQQQSIIEQQQDTLEMVTDRIEDLEQQPAPQPIVRSNPSLERQLKEDAERRAKARAILEGDE